MNSSKNKNDRLLTGSIIAISVIGIVYFGFQAISDNSKKIRKIHLNIILRTLKRVVKNYYTIRKRNKYIWIYNKLSVLLLERMIISMSLVTSPF